MLRDYADFDCSASGKYGIFPIFLIRNPLLFDYDISQRTAVAFVYIHNRTIFWSLQSIFRSFPQNHEWFLWRNFFQIVCPITTHSTRFCSRNAHGNSSTADTNGERKSLPAINFTTACSILMWESTMGNITWIAVDASEMCNKWPAFLRDDAGEWRWWRLLQHVIRRLHDDYYESQWARAHYGKLFKNNRIARIVVVSFLYSWSNKRHATQMECE